MGRELVKQLAATGCHVALCDVSAEHMATTRAEALRGAPPGTRVTAHLCDVADEKQMLAFRDAVLREHQTACVHLVFNNAGIAGGGSFVQDDRADWERTLNVCWYGVYYNTRAFLPMLIASDDACIVNTSSVNGFWASIGPGVAHTAYSTAKFAVKGFTEALMTDLRLHAPHVKAVLVMVYARVLTLEEPSPAARYAYLALYNLIYVTPLAVIVALFVRTLGARRLTEREGPLLKLLSGVMMLGLGVVLLVAPELTGNAFVGLGLIAVAVAVTWIAARLTPAKPSAA